MTLGKPAHAVITQMSEIVLLCGQPPAPSAAPGFVQGQCGNPLGQGQDQCVTFNWRHGQPFGNFAARTPATDAEPGFWLDNADLDTGRFNRGVAQTVHASNVGCVRLWAMARRDMACQTRVNS